VSGITTVIYTRRDETFFNNEVPATHILETMDEILTECVSSRSVRSINISSQDFFTYVCFFNGGSNENNSGAIIVAGRFLSTRGTRFSRGLKTPNSLLKRTKQKLPAPKPSAHVSCKPVKNGLKFYRG